MFFSVGHYDCLEENQLTQIVISVILVKYNGSLVGVVQVKVERCRQFGMRGRARIYW